MSDTRTKTKPARLSAPLPLGELVTRSLYCALLACALLVSAASGHTLLNHENSIGDSPQTNGARTGGNGRQSNKLVQAAPSQSGYARNGCQPGWMWFNNKCWVATQSRRDFSHAVEICKKMYNSTLPTIHSEEENEFLKQNMNLQNSPIWLYARHNHQYNKTRWLDKSPVNYTQWDAGQPSDKSSLICIKTEESWYMKKTQPVDGQTECVSFWEDAKWGTQVGCSVLLPVVCEKKVTISRLTDGPNGSVSSQYEQQQMYAVSAGHAYLRLPHLLEWRLAEAAALGWGLLLATAGR